MSRIQFSKTARSFARNFSSLPRSRPFVLNEQPDGKTAVSFGSNVQLGLFPTNLNDSIAPGFLLAPNSRSDPEILVPKPSIFEENRKFWSAAGELIKNNIHQDPVYCNLIGGETKTKFFHIYDMRLLPLYGRIPEVEDILGTVELDIGKDETNIVPYSFQPNSMYRPVSQYGAMLVSDMMFDLMKRQL